MSKEDLIFVEVKNTFMLTPSQAKRVLAVARALTADYVFHTKDEDGCELTVRGDDFLTEKGEHDVAAAMGEVPDPGGLLGIEFVHQTTRPLSPKEIEGLTRPWPEGWEDRAFRDDDED
ncbi:MAG: hypothetical protein P1U75_00445 [Antarcticimicrobium sp.]|uniref:hypothetical protein n=1 Tax=Antarcticimicrobium sp. TaxID=2824147 RepID=UPI0026381F65|nr:hypothetical protein [Antarcticimicrobium sp.]MDF1715130.1 hypothetical protein [Antarcticimicrobium sp.]